MSHNALRFRAVPHRIATPRLVSSPLVSPFSFTRFLCSSKCDNKLDSDVRNERHFRFWVFSALFSLFFPFDWKFYGYVGGERYLYVCEDCFNCFFFSFFRGNIRQIVWKSFLIWLSYMGYLSMCVCKLFSYLEFSHISLGDYFKHILHCLQCLYN